MRARYKDPPSITPSEDVRYSSRPIGSVGGRTASIPSSFLIGEKEEKKEQFNDFPEEGDVALMILLLFSALFSTTRYKSESRPHQSIRTTQQPAASHYLNDSSSTPFP